jgi:GMP synthase (glutamine-hydrolysing)
MSRVVIVQHAAVEPPGTIGEVLTSRGFDVRVVRTFAGEAVPSLGASTALVLMGGPMSVYEEHLHQREEKRLIREAIDAGKPVLGICLGSQLLASVLGARVVPGPEKEIGWFPITLLHDGRADELFTDEPSPFVAFHWHGDVFEVPPGARPLARSERTPFQGFRYGDSAYGLLFHLEVEEGQIAAMAAAFDKELEQSCVPANELLVGASRYMAEVRARGQRVFGRWADLIDR